MNKELNETELTRYGIEKLINGDFVRYGKVLKAKKIFTLDEGYESDRGIFSLVNEDEKFLFGLGSLK